MAALRHFAASTAGGQQEGAVRAQWPGPPLAAPRGPSRSARVSALGGRQLKESPQAQEPDAFGLSIVKPCFSIVSTKSMVAPVR